MQFWFIRAAVAGVFFATAMSLSSFGAQAARTDAKWVLRHDSRSGPVLSWSTSADGEVLSMECVGPGRDIPILDQSRPFNTIIYLDTAMARIWLGGREVFALVLGADGWRRVEMIAVRDSLVIGPKQTARALVLLNRGAPLRIKIVASMQHGTQEHDIDVPVGNFTVLRQRHLEACEDYYQSSSSWSWRKIFP